MENEIMNYEEEVMEPEFEIDEVEREESGMSAGVAVLIGAGVTAAGIAAVKLGKKLYAKIKARKELRQPDEDEIVEVTDEDIMDVTE